MTSGQRVPHEHAPERPAAAATDDARGLAARVLRLQRTVGNRGARRALARFAVTVALTEPGAARAAAAVLNNSAATADWLNVVPDADAGATVTTTLKGAKQVVQYHAPPKPKPKKGEAPRPEPASAPIDPARQKAIDDACKAVADYRATLPEPAVTSGITSNQGAKWAGTSWTRYTAMQERLRPPTPTNKNPKPADTRTAAHKAAYESAASYAAWLSGLGKSTGSRALPGPKDDVAAYRSWLGDRLFLDIAGLEGGTDSINVYDKQIVTWGGGLGGASGAVPAAMKRVADSTATGGGRAVGAEVTRVLHAAGIGFSATGGGVEFVVCDPGSKHKYRGDSALQLIKADNRLLMLFTNIARGELPGVDVNAVPAPVAGQPPGQSLKDATRKAVFDAQKDYFLNRYYSGDFGAAVQQLGGTWPYESIMMVLHLEWWGVTRWSQFRATGGDMKKIIKRAFELYTSYAETRNGAHVATRDLAAHLQTFGGASSEACWRPVEQLAPDKLQSGAYYAEVKPAVEAKAAVPDTVKDGKVVKKGTPEVVAQDAKYRKLKD